MLWGGTDQLKELKRLQKENERLRGAFSDLTLYKLILPEAAKGISKPRRRRACIHRVFAELNDSERRVCLVLRQN